MPYNLLTETVDPSYQNLDQLKVLKILELMNAGDQAVAAAVAVELPKIADAIEAIVPALEVGGRLFYIGAGTSGRLGVLDASECPPTFNVPSELVQGIIAGGEKSLAQATEASEDDPAAGVQDLQAAGFSMGDVLAGIAASGRTPYVLGAVQWARVLGAITIGISCTENSQLSQAVQFPIEPKPGPEIIAGSTRLRAGTATKLVLNMISTVVMIRLGHIYGNLMVNVQPSNQKLTARACGIIAQVTGVSEERAGELLKMSGSAKTAIVMEKRGVSLELARQLLERNRGRLRAALESPLPQNPRA